MKPIRCYSCNKILGNKWETIDKMKQEGKELKEIYEYLNITRYCCKRIIMTTVDISEIEDPYENIQYENIKIYKENPNVNFLKAT